MKRPRFLKPFLKYFLLVGMVASFEFFTSKTYAEDRLSFAAGGDVGGGGGDVGGGGGELVGVGGDVGGGTGGTSTEQRCESASHLNIQNVRAYQGSLVDIAPLYELGYQGQNSTVAIIDSGLSPSFAKKPLVFKDFTGLCESSKPCDGHSHGTIVADIVSQLAPQADLISLKVLDSHAHGKTKNAVKALKWVIEHKDEYHIKVVNMSLVSSDSFAGAWDETDDLRAQIKIASDLGIFVVVAVGNDAQSFVNVAPANSPEAITVGSFNHNRSTDRNAFSVSPFTNIGEADAPYVTHIQVGFSNITQREMTRWVIKPDILAPGGAILAYVGDEVAQNERNKLISQIEASSSPQTEELIKTLQPLLSRQQKYALLAEVISNGHDAKSAIQKVFMSCPVNPGYAVANGTSFASAFVSGGIAALLSAIPNLQPTQLKKALKTTAVVPFARVEESGDLIGSIDFAKLYQEFLK